VESELGPAVYEEAVTVGQHGGQEVGGADQGHQEEEVEQGHQQGGGGPVDGTAMAIQVQPAANLEAVEGLEYLEVSLDAAHYEGDHGAAQEDPLDALAIVSDTECRSKDCHSELSGKQDEATGHPDSFVGEVVADVVQVYDHPKEASECADETASKNQKVEGAEERGIGRS